jgi:hypothetical protein
MQNRHSADLDAELTKNIYINNTNKSFEYEHRVRKLHDYPGKGFFFGGDILDCS